MDWNLLITQLLNGLQYGILLFLLASGLTLIFGIMDFLNLAHGSFYMLGGYFCATLVDFSGSFLFALIVAIAGVFLVGLAIEKTIVRRLYAYDHLSQVLATVGLILVFDTLVQIIWGVEGMAIPLPTVLALIDLQLVSLAGGSDDDRNFFRKVLESRPPHVDVVASPFEARSEDVDTFVSGVLRVPAEGAFGG